MTSMEPTVVYDIVKQRLVLQVNANIGSSSQTVLQLLSTDDGQTWSTPVDIGTAFLGNDKNVVVGPGTGTQITLSLCFGSLFSLSLCLCLQHKKNVWWMCTQFMKYLKTCCLWFVVRVCCLRNSVTTSCLAFLGEAFAVLAMLVMDVHRLDEHQCN